MLMLHAPHRCRSALPASEWCFDLMCANLLAVVMTFWVAQTCLAQDSDFSSNQSAASQVEASPVAGVGSADDPASRLGPGDRAIVGSGVRPQSTNESQPPSYKILRYDEDYRYLRDRSKRTDPWDPIKYIPLGNDPDYYLSFGGEVRERVETYHNPDFGAGPSNPNGFNTYPTQRYMTHADLHLGRHVRVFTQTVTGLEYGAIGGPRPQIDFNEFGFHQAFVDIVQFDDDSVTNNSLTWRLGRQELFYGSGRLIDVREGVNLRQSFDGARFLAKRNEWAIDGFWTRPVLNNPYCFDDIPDPQRTFWGLYTVRPLERLPDGHVDLYYLGFTNSQASYNQIAGSELRHTIGTRVWGGPMPFEYNVECMFQFGQFGEGSIQAWSVASAARYNFSTTALKPRLGLRADIASGDRNSNSANLQSFNPLYPSGVYFNLANPVGPINMIDLHPTLDLSLTEKLTFTADWNFFWRESLGDGIYSLSGRLLRPAGNDLSRYIGNTPSMTLVWAASRHVTVLASYVHVFPGPFIQESPPDLPTDYVTGWVTYKF